jgi:hypothetical protein
MRPRESFVVRALPRGGPAARRALALCVAAGLWAAVIPSAATQQPPAVRPRRAAAKPRPAAAEPNSLAERAAAAACLERELDPRGSMPIDVMQARPSLPARHPEVAEGARRAARMLPAARELTGEVLLGLMREHRVPAGVARAALRRLNEARRVRADVELRDNASVLYSDPRTIRFGTIFLAGLRSDEGMLSVLAHELVHTADGARGDLSPLFRRVGLRAERAARTGRLSARRAEELTCDLVGVLAVRLFIEREPSDEPAPRRASRAVGHNCVEHDETDVTHLSPRQTLLALLALEPAFAGQLTGDAAHEAGAPLNHTAPRRPRP